MTTREIRLGLDSIFPGAITSSIGSRADSTTATLMRFNRGESSGNRPSPAGATGAGGEAPASALVTSSLWLQPASKSTAKAAAIGGADPLVRSRPPGRLPARAEVFRAALPRPTRASAADQGVRTTVSV